MRLFTKSTYGLQNFYRSMISISILLSVLIFSGCASFYWSDKVNRELEPKTNGLFNEAYHLGNYLGIKDVAGNNYYHYIFPNIFSESHEKFIDILISVDESPHSAVIQLVEDSVSSASPAYIRYNYVFRYQENAGRVSLYPINPKAIAKDFSTDYPSLITLTLGQIGEKIRIRAGRKLNSSEYTALEGKTLPKGWGSPYIVICPETKVKPDYFKNIYDLINHRDLYPIVPDGMRHCDVWVWSDVIESVDVYEPGIKRYKETKRFLGYFVTVPVDVLTSPVQLPFWIAFYGFVQAWHFK